ncbi:CRISPR subtype III-A-associated RAMP protein Csm2 [Thermoanaerobacter kivui]|uniref:CRISPR system Cms protein Csm2 n=1 Tax=Thermoanaerobacter kivui TaxID=2325 RepID=A0A097ASU8_THEKI|nr:type III-A CRISPR-associated protein Csm2 [Thermoanaerobacter kivui]AIS52888.1 CRISPR subtype III-A-associated RAMP protein Csm2 [Thermoanaerobacter kivui]
MPNVNIRALKNEILKEVKTAINPDKDKDGKVFSEVAKKTGHLLKESNVTVTQLRKVFTEVKRLSPEDENYKYKLKLLKAKMAYTSGRFPKLKDFQDIVDEALPIAEQNEKTLERFKDFFEAVVAYHKFFGGRE